MKTLLVRPVLVASKEQTNLWSYKGRRLYYNQANFNDEDETTYYRVVLVSLDPNEKIERGNKVVTNNVDYFDTEIQLCTMSEFLDSDNIIKFGINNQIKVYKFGYNKVIATHDQLSPDHIHKLVDEYNNGGMQDFEIEMDWILNDPKINGVDYENTPVPDYPIVYTEEDMNKAFDIGYQWGKTDKSEAPLTFLWRIFNKKK